MISMERVEGTPTLEEIRARYEAAMREHPGPWHAEDGEHTWDLYSAPPVITPPEHLEGAMREMFQEGLLGHPLKILKAPKKSEEYAEYWPPRATATFMVHAPSDVAALLAEIERLQAQLSASSDSKREGSDE